MKNDQPLDYRLRVATKRTDLPEDVIRLLADAYYEIWLDKERVQVLQDKCDSLLSTNVELEVRIKSIKEGFEGCCPVCEPVGEMNKKLREEGSALRSAVRSYLSDDIARLRAERDEARRAACKDEAIIRLQRNRVHRDSEEVLRMAKEISVERGWDCFKENP
jgi:hypothetical protein